MVSWVLVFDGLVPGFVCQQSQQTGEMSKNSFGDCFEAMRGVRADDVEVLQLLARL